uniref:SHSP domain-containing protein n=1 Tax=Araucaria cunninghamii TaxID=56994 RepID=A0A0D6R9F8_ARACU
MESESANRRIHQIACHLIANNEVGGGILFPMSCSGTMNSVIKRYDNMVLFARQGTSSQGYYMRQVTIKQFPENDARSASHMGAPLECTSEFSSACDKRTFVSNASQDPIFSRPAEFQQGSTVSLEIPQQQLQNTQPAAARSPLFAKPASGINKVGKSTSTGHLTGEIINNFSGLEWSPKMDVAESGCAYVVTIELPGVAASGIRAEVDDKRLIVTGKRSTEWWKEGNDKSAVYHKRELSEGPYHVVWQLPANSNKDAVSAEFIDGLLQIRIPKKDQ